MKPEIIIAVSGIISALATFVIAAYTVISHRLSSKIDRAVNSNQKTTEKLIKDLKIALLMVATKSRSADAAKMMFDEYKDKFP